MVHGHHPHPFPTLVSPLPPLPVRPPDLHERRRTELNPIQDTALRASAGGDTGGYAILSRPPNSPFGYPASALQIRTRHRLVAPWTARLDVLAWGACDVLAGTSRSRCAAMCTAPGMRHKPRRSDSLRTVLEAALGHLTRLVDSDGEGCVRVPSGPRLVSSRLSDGGDDQQPCCQAALTTEQHAYHERTHSYERIDLVVSTAPAPRC